MNKLNAVRFPNVQGERHYMVPFFKKQGLPSDLAHWQPTVSAMLDGVDTDAPIFLMIDQGFVKGGATLRRPGVHIDGHWVPSLVAHRGGDHRGTIQMVGHLGGGGHLGSPSGTPGHQGGTPGHRGSDVPVRLPTRPARKPKNSPGKKASALEEWTLDAVDYDETLILASNVAGCEVYLGHGPMDFGVRGDCSHVDVSGFDRHMLVDGFAHAIGVGDLHASVPIVRDVYRTLVRLNVPGVRL